MMSPEIRAASALAWPPGTFSSMTQTAETASPLLLKANPMNQPCGSS